MKITFLTGSARACRFTRRTGVTLVLIAVMMVVLFAMLAFSIDLGYLHVVAGQLQNTADAAALAGALELMDPDRLRGGSDMGQEISAARQTAVRFAGLNSVANSSPGVDANSSNDPAGEVVIGYLKNPEQPDSPMLFDNPVLYNAVQVRVRRTEARNGVIPLFFAQILGNKSASMGTKATAMFDDRVAGFRLKDGSPVTTTGLLPFAVNKADWEAMLAGGGTDNWDYDRDTKSVSPGSDQIRELKLFPTTNNNKGESVPGNFGTLQIGDPDSTSFNERVKRQVRDGVSYEDLQWYGGELGLSQEGTLTLNGDTGLSVGMKQAIEDAIGQARSVCLYTQVSGQGENATFTIVGFAGMRIVDAHLEGSLDHKYIKMQPAFSVDAAAFTDSSRARSSFLYKPVALVR